MSRIQIITTDYFLFAIIAVQARMVRKSATLRYLKMGVANNYEGYYGSIAQRHSKAANILFIDRHVERIQNGNTDGMRNEGWPNGQDGS